MFFTSEDEPTPTDWPLNEGEAITRVTPSDSGACGGARPEDSDPPVVVSVNLARYDPGSGPLISRLTPGTPSGTTWWA